MSVQPAAHSAAVQTIWAELIAASLADAGVRVCVISPGSRSTPLVAALAALARSQVELARSQVELACSQVELARSPVELASSGLELVTIIDERAAAFYALGVARATDRPAALVCTSGSAAAHYLPAIVEASMAHVPLVVVTADRPPELQGCGASQTIDQRGIYGSFVRGAFDLGAPVASEASLRAMRRTIVQAVTLSRGGSPGPVHINVPLRKPLEPAAPATALEHELARLASSLRAAQADDREPRPMPPRLVADGAMIDAAARAILDEPDGAIVVGAMPASFAAARDNLLALAVRAGYPVIAEAGSQLRMCARDGVVCVDHFDLVPTSELPKPKLVIQIGAEPLAAGWQAWLAAAKPARWIFAGHAWHDPESNARAVILGDVADAIARVVDMLEQIPSIEQRSAAKWAALEARAARASAKAIELHVSSETAVLQAAIAALPDDAVVQIGNSLPIRVIDHVVGKPCTVITQRGAAGIDGLIASAAGATHAGKPTLLVLGDVSFAHDLGGLLATRAAVAPLAILVVDNGGGQIFAGLPIAKSEPVRRDAFAEHWLTAPQLDPVAVASAVGIRATTASSPAEVASAVEAALANGVTVIHAPVSASGAHDVRRTAIELFSERSQYDEHRVDPVARV